MRNSLISRTSLSQRKASLVRSKQLLIQELITSEIKYISYLKKAIKYFAEPLSNPKYLPFDIHTEIFGRLLPICTVNETLLESVLTVGVEKAFLKITPCLKLYADYARRYQISLVFLETCITFVPGLFEIINKQENLSDVGMQLSAFLIMPIQRIPRYSLMLQELVIIYLQLDGLSLTESRECIHSFIQEAQSQSLAPEYAASIILASWDNFIQDQSRLSSLNSYFPALKALLHRVKFSTLILIAGFVSIVATASFLNEKIRISEQATKAALLQSKLLGQWTRNLILLPGRRLLRYGLIKKKNSLDGQLQLRLLVILSDILIYATPKANVNLDKIIMGNRKNCKTAKEKQKSTISKSYFMFHPPIKSSKFHLNYLRFKFNNNFLKHLFKINNDQTTSNSASFQDLQNYEDILTDSRVRFSCAAVYPLHHCWLERHYNYNHDNNSVQLNHHQQLFDSNNIYNHFETKKYDSSVVSVQPSSNLFEPITPPMISNDMISEDTQVSSCKSLSTRIHSLETKKENVNVFSFTVHCQEANFTIVCENLNEAEGWISSLETAIHAVKMARASLRKASSAKCPMRILDFVQFEHWLNNKRMIEEFALSCQHAHPVDSTDEEKHNSLPDLYGLKMERKLEYYRERKSIGFEDRKTINRFSLYSLCGKSGSWDVNQPNRPSHEDILTKIRTKINGKRKSWPHIESINTNECNDLVDLICVKPISLGNPVINSSTAINSEKNVQFHLTPSSESTPIFSLINKKRKNKSFFNFGKIKFDRDKYIFARQSSIINPLSKIAKSGSLQISDVGLRYLFIFSISSLIRELILLILILCISIHYVRKYLINSIMKKKEI